MTLTSPDTLSAPIALRSPETVMRLGRMGAFFPTRLSFMRRLIRRMTAERWAVGCAARSLDENGYGHAVWQADTGNRIYSLVAFSTQLDPDQRTDRVIAEAWDASFVLFDGVPTADDIARLRANAPRQEAGRYQATDLTLSRANKSVRLFDHVATCLAAGRQPNAASLAGIGYLMRTTAVYGNGKFGIADRAVIRAREEVAGPFQAEMLTVYLIRCFTLDLVEHVARAMAPETAVPLAPHLKRHLGIGNSTGLGMAPFLVSHPILIHRWMSAREDALARVRSLESLSTPEIAGLTELCRRARAHVAEWNVADPRQAERIAILREDLISVSAWIADLAPETPRPLDRLFRRAEQHLSVEGQELLVAILIELRPDLVDGLADTMASDETESLDPRWTVGRLAAEIDRVYDWALALDFDDPEAVRHFWYVSEEKLEPRLGDRHEEPGADKEMPLAIARDIQGLRQALRTRAQDEPIAALLMERPEFRHLVRRAQTVARYPYAEIRDNLIGRACLPIDLLRCKLSFFGASKFDPKSDLWTRITLYQGAPLPEEIARGDGEDWAFPALLS
ncbi:MAG: hypothetical protein NXI19_15865 [Alphaproteobacteria bacterium]|nr:hypothetical protein [Alphaproteobacteria bacterium]